MNEDAICETCIYLDELERANRGGYAGLCRANPPHVNETGDAVWPWVRPDDWCGYWDDGEEDEDEDEDA